jgi:hypothetical protein
VALAVTLFIATGVWEYVVSGRYKLIVIGMLALGLLMIADRQRRASASGSTVGLTDSL